MKIIGENGIKKSYKNIEYNKIK